MTKTATTEVLDYLATKGYKVDSVEREDTQTFAKGTTNYGDPIKPFRVVWQSLQHSGRMTTEELSKVEARYQRATAKAEQVRQERAALIAQALAEGWTHAKIARATGLTRGRIGQMAQQ